MLKNKPKILTIAFALVFALQITSLASLSFIAAYDVNAATEIKLPLQIGIPGTKDTANGDQYDFGPGSTLDLTNETTIRPIGEYIKWIYKYMIGVVGILSTIVMMWGGVLWLASAGDSGKITDAKAWITSSITGLLLALSSYLILATINPNLVNFNSRVVTGVSEKGIDFGFDPTIPCGEYNSSKKTCGSKCDANKKCESATKGVSGARECPTSLNGKGSYWICSDMSASGASCCTSDSSCGSGYHCNKAILCASGGFGVCSLPLGNNGQCSGPQDCASGFVCNSGRCKSNAPTAGQTCKDSGGVTAGTCAAGFYCDGWAPGINPGTCQPCRTTGQSCSGAVTGNGECCKGDCVDNPGLGTGNSCN